jgi:hypothetical protein
MVKKEMTINGLFTVIVAESEVAIHRCRRPLSSCADFLCSITRAFMPELTHSALRSPTAWFGGFKRQMVRSGDKATRGD